jgi:hypothetical protein
MDPKKQALNDLDEAYEVEALPERGDQPFP